MTDTGLVAPQSATTCLKFTAAGTFHYRCTEHGFKGIVTVSQ
jgi:plastocyanin